MKITVTKNISNDTLSLCRKVFGFLVALLLIMPLNAIGSHRAVNAVKPPYTKEGLVEILPEEWMAFWNAADIARDVDLGDIFKSSLELATTATGINSTWAISNAAAWNALQRIELSDREELSSSAVNTIWNYAFAEAWKAPNGSAYKIIRFNNLEYFENLVMILRSQTKMLRDLVQIPRI